MDKSLPDKIPIQAPEIAVVPVEHVRVWTDVPFQDVIRRLEAATGFFDVADITKRVAAHETPATVIDAIKTMAGASGFMRFLKADHGQLLRLTGQTAHAVRYLIGHPMIAARMTQRAIGSALYAPLSLLISSDNHRTSMEYDRPSTLFAQFRDSEIAAVAVELDQKLDALIRSISDIDKKEE